MVQYYRGIWHKRSHLIALLTNLGSEIRQTKVVKSNGTKKEAWYWTKGHQDTFDAVKQTLAIDVMLPCPPCRELFEIYIYALLCQLGAVMVPALHPDLRKILTVSRSEMWSSVKTWLNAEQLSK